MLKMKNKFIYFVIFLIVLIISVAIYIAVFQKWVDRNSYVELIAWTALLNDKDLEIKKREKLWKEDVITTTSKESLAVIEWWDGSVTRLWWNTSLKVSDLFVSNNKDKLNISFELLKWKTWSTVVSFITEGSYFTQSFMDVEAAVRWTTFNVDLEKNYLYVLKNQVELIKSNWEKIEIDENNPFDLKTFTFIKLEEFIKSFKDTAFENLNMELDTELLSFIKQKAQESLQSFVDFINIQTESLSEIKKEELYAGILSKYQELNVVNSDDWILYDIKLSLKEKLYELAPNEEKQAWFNSLISDFKGISWVEVEEKLTESKIKIQNLLGEYIGKIEVPEGLKEAFKDSFNRLKNTLVNLFSK